MGRRHEARGLFVAHDHELYARAPKRFEHVEVLFPRHRENALDALVLERRDKQLRAFLELRHVSHLGFS